MAGSYLNEFNIFDNIQRIDQKAGIQFLNILLLGQEELGKSTFGAMLLQPFNQQDETEQDLNGTDAEKLDSENVVYVDFDKPQGKEQIDSWKRFKSYVAIPMKFEEDSSLIVSIQETPFMLDNSKPKMMENVISYVQKQTNDFIEQEFDSDIPYYDIVDKRIHLCMYFLPPFGNINQDLDNIKRMSKVVTVMPVIARADCLNYTLGNSQLQVITRKEQIKRLLEDKKIDYLKFPKEILTKAQATEDQIMQSVFAVAGSRYQKTGDQIQPLITYKFDQDFHVNVMYVSDSQLVSTLLLDEGLKFVKSLSQQKYIQMRNQRMRSKDFQLPRLTRTQSTASTLNDVHPREATRESAPMQPKMNIQFQNGQDYQQNDVPQGSDENIYDQNFQNKHKSKFQNPQYYNKESTPSYENLSRPSLNQAYSNKQKFSNKLANFTRRNIKE